MRRLTTIEKCLAFWIEHAECYNVVEVKGCLAATESTGGRGGNHTDIKIGHPVRLFKDIDSVLSEAIQDQAEREILAGFEGRRRNTPSSTWYRKRPKIYAMAIEALSNSGVITKIIKEESDGI